MTAMRGFSLIEIVISLFIIGVILVLMHAVIQSSSLIRTTKNQGIALSIARNEIESLRAGGYATLPASGTFSDSLISTLPALATTTRTVSVYDAKTKQVTASVIWRDAGANASSTVSLSTLITSVGGLP